MHEVALPRAHGTIFICDSFGIGGDRQHDTETLRRCHRDLRVGGALVFNDYPIDDSPEESEEQFPDPWPETDERKRTAGGDESAVSSRVVALDPLAQRLTRQIRARLWRGDTLIREEEGILLTKLNFRNELVPMLEAAGFATVEVRAGYSDLPAGPDDTMVVYIARE